MLRPPSVLGPLLAVGICVGQVALAYVLDGIPTGARAQGTGAALTTALFILAGYFMGRYRRRAAVHDGWQPVPWTATFTLSVVSTALGLLGWWGGVFNPVFPAVSIGEGGMARGMLATDAVFLVPFILSSVGAALGANARPRATMFGGGGAVILLGLSLLGWELARFLLLDPNGIRLLATISVGVAALLVGFLLAWARKQLAFVEMAITALLVGYAIYLTVAVGPSSLVVSWSLPIEQILLALSIVPSVAIMAFLAVGGSLGFLLFGGGRFDPGFQYEVKVALRYLQVNLPRATRAVFVTAGHVVCVLTSVCVSVFMDRPQPVWWGVLFSVLALYLIVYLARMSRLTQGFRVAIYLVCVAGMAMFGLDIAPRILDPYFPLPLDRQGFGYWGAVYGLGLLIAAMYSGLWAALSFWSRSGVTHKRDQKPLFVGVVTTISVLGVAIGVMALIVVLSVMSGFEADLKSKILGAHAHVVVEKYGDDFTEYETVETKVRDVPYVETAAAFVLGDAMITTDEGLISGTLVKGIEPDSEDAVGEIRRNLLRGDVGYLLQPDRIPGACEAAFRKVSKPKPPPSGDERRPPDATATATSGIQGPVLPDVMHVSGASRCSGRVLPGVLIGRQLSHQLGARIGHVVKLISPVSEEIGPLGPTPKLRRFRVAGIFYTGMYEYDAKHAYISMRQAQKFFGQRGRATGVELKITDIDLSGLVARDIERQLGGQPYHARDWREMHKELFSALLLEKIAMFVALAMIIMVASFLIVATLVMIVLQRGREIAILKSVGSSDASIMKIFVIQGVIVGLSGSLLGVGAGVGICLLLGQVGLQLDNSVFYIELLPVVMNWSEIGVIAVSAMIITYLATIYPAMTAAVLRPVEGLREE